MHGMLPLWLRRGLVGFEGRHLVRVGFGGGCGCHLGRDSGSRRRTFIRFVDVVSEDLCAKHFWMSSRIGVLRV